MRYSLFLPLLLLLLTASSATAAEPLRISGRAFDRPVEIRVRDLPRLEAEFAGRRALAEIIRLQDLTDPQRPTAGGTSELNARAGRGPLEVDPDFFGLLRRALEFCIWSERAHGPLGGRLYRFWGLREKLPDEAEPADLRVALASATCTNLTLDQEAGNAILASGSRVDLWGFAVGYAVDRAVALMKQEGVNNGWVAVGRVKRAFGPGPDGSGWLAPLPIFEGLTEPLDEIRLRDQALAVVSREDGVLERDGERFAAYLDQRRGKPVRGVVAVAGVTELAVDAEALAVTMFVTGSFKGQLLLGVLRPSPSVLWLLGSGKAGPVMSDYHWSDLKLRR
jgi:thiamine biosynthesis lipoprotein